MRGFCFIWKGKCVFDLSDCCDILLPSSSSVPTERRLVDAEQEPSHHPDQRRGVRRREPDRRHAHGRGSEGAGLLHPEGVVRDLLRYAEEEGNASRSLRVRREPDRHGRGLGGVPLEGADQQEHGRLILRASSNSAREDFFARGFSYSTVFGRCGTPVVYERSVFAYASYRKHLPLFIEAGIFCKRS